ncbi:MAG: CvpA family protein [Lachnospiraceae bacterium]|nr:CvpA family protein [Lachnospiraceae bacterium]
MNWVAITCLAVLVVLGLVGLKLGVVKMLYHLVAFALALVLTAVIAPIVSDAVIKEDSAAVEKVKEKVVKTLKLDEIKFDATISDDILEKLNLPESIREEIKTFNTKEDYKTIGADDAKDYLSTTMAVIVMQAAVYLIVFLIMWLIVFLVFHAANLIDKLPGLHAINRLAGLCVGLILAACIILVFFVAVTALSNLPAGQEMLKCIEENSILKFWYDNNPLNGGFVYLSSKFKK